MHPDIEAYREDRRLVLVGALEDEPEWHEMGMVHLYAIDKICSANWHWLGFHFCNFPPHPTAQNISRVAAFFERKLPGLGKRFIDSIALVRDRERHKPDYETILQILSEMLIIERLLLMPWHEDAELSYEPG